MSYIGQTLPADTFQGFTTDSFSGDGSATTFTLSKTPFNESALLVVINNVVQKPTTNFTVSGTTLTIVGTAVASGDVIYATHIGGALPIGQAASLDLNGASDQLILDADADTTISADTDDQIDFKLGASDIATLTTSSLTLKNSATGDDSPFTLKLQTAEADIAADDVIGKIEFQAPNEGTGTDANLVCASIEAISQGNFAADANLTCLSFKTANSEAASEKMRLTDVGALFLGTATAVDNNTVMQLEHADREYLVIRNTSQNGIKVYSDDTIVFYAYDRTENAATGGITFSHVDGDTRFYTKNSGGSFSEKFRIAANGDLTGTDTSISSNSDQRLKQNIQDYSYDISKFKQFKPRSFDWINKEEHNGETNNRGFIAQEISSVDNYWVSETNIVNDESIENNESKDKELLTKDSDGNYKSYTSKLGKKDAMYISVIQQLITRIEALEDA